MANFQLGQGDTGPTLEVVPIMPDGSVADIEGADLEFFMTAYGSPLATAVGTPVELVPDTEEPKIRHDWSEDETAVPGTFWFQIRGTLRDGKAYTFPTERPGYYTVEIYPQV
jgi:hypothetical protein